MSNDALDFLQSKKHKHGGLRKSRLLYILKVDDTIMTFYRKYSIAEKKCARLLYVKQCDLMYS